MKLAKDQVVLQLSRSAYNKLPVEVREALQVYSEQSWLTRSGLCFVVADSRLDELHALAGGGALPNLGSRLRVQRPTNSPRPPTTGSQV